MGNILDYVPCRELPAGTAVPPPTPEEAAIVARPVRPIPVSAPQPQLGKPPSFRARGSARSQQDDFYEKYELLNIIGKYILLECILTHKCFRKLNNISGTGSTSQVKRCRERSTSKEFACKVIDKRKVHSQYSPLMEQFENEVGSLLPHISVCGAHRKNPVSWTHLLTRLFFVYP